MIKFIEIDKIYSHPDNPRKDLGDLTELAESIEISGILQNLTVIPWFSVGNRKEICTDESMEDKYTVVIGHRRLAAAKLAGLEEVPCAIVDMDHKTQVATMLLENMQRSDLTAYEQAQGFQMMLDLGESVAGISEKTGFSKGTVRSRMKLLELDQEKLKESTQRGATLMDYAELEKIEDIELRNKVLEKVGTDDFNWSLRDAIDKEKRKKRSSELIEQLSEFATEVDSRSNLRYVKSYGTNSDETVEEPNDADTTKYFYEAGLYFITLYKENIETEKSTEADEEERIKREKREARKVKLNEISDRAYKLRADFIKSLSNTKARKNMETVIEASLFANTGSGICIEYEDLAEIMGIDISDKDDIEWNDIVGHIWKQPELYLLQATYHQLDSTSERYFDWNGRYDSNEDLDYVYDFLQKLGYKMSEEEKQLQDGTHELFKSEEEN
ncbi:ParB/RepB/Spo0J family partition protein [Tissierella sp.]|uniref:ParB/RepB/Spo0J family partition protein n=1 Tax=Tissierella sp. TaxID=41274 RepID=UPI00304D4A60